jgi:hypothetical protein
MDEQLQAAPDEVQDPAGAPPRKLTNVSSHSAFRPDYARVGVRIDGVERDDIIFYDADRLVYRTTSDHPRLGEDRGAISIEPFWRYPESRQMRRARERWERGR